MSSTMTSESNGTLDAQRTSSTTVAINTIAGTTVVVITMSVVLTTSENGTYPSSP